MIRIIYSDKEIEIEWREGITVADAVLRLCELHGCDAIRIMGRIMGAGVGQEENCRYVCKMDFEKTLVSDGEEIYILPLIVGG
ncbi:MAG: MoaD/ThiS family protein [Candidatus Portnoybacteria bacterium]|nr:MoaD/ThiS family protein [Candidatus Portnoybacteria bacterium]